MQLKRFRSASVREALAQARVELGPDALVLATRLVPVRGVRGWIGKREVELTAAHSSGVSDSRPAERRPDIPERTAEPKPPDEKRLTGHREDALVARLCATGVPRDWAERMVDDLPRAQRRHVSAAALERVAAKQLQDLVAPDDAYAPVELFIGPPGAGKTTTIAKIAAQERARRGATLLEERGLPVSYLGTGQRVPEDLERATATGLATHVMGISEPMERRA